MKYLYSELIFIGCEIAELVKRAKYNEATALIRSLNPLQSAYAFKYAIDNCDGTELKLLMGFIERTMNEGEKL